MSACVSTQEDVGFLPLRKLEQKPDLSEIKNAIKKTCFHNEKSYLYSDLILMKQTILIEGLWESGFENLFIKAIDLAGNEYLSFDIEKNDIHIEERNPDNAGRLDKDFLTLIDLVGKLGAKNVRKLVCLNDILPDDMDSNLFKNIEDKDRGVSGVYRSLAPFKTGQGTFYLHNEFEVRKGTESFNLEVKMKVCENRSTSKCLGTLYWKGSLHDGKIVPQSLELKDFQFSKITLMFLDFE